MEKLKTKDSLIQKYVSLTREKLDRLKLHEIMHISRDENIMENILSKLASTRTSRINHFFIEEILRGTSFENLEAMMRP